jgi:hypothetical protein
MYSEFTCWLYFIKIIKFFGHALSLFAHPFSHVILATVNKKKEEASGANR